MAMDPGHRRILELLAAGHTYEQILAASPALTYMDLFNAIQTALDMIDSATQPAYSMEAAREKFPNAYRPWTKADDDELLRRYRGGDSVKELAEHFQRSLGAIQARLVKLLIEPLGLADS